MMLKQAQNQDELRHELKEDERRLLEEFRAGRAEEIICLLKACGSLPAHWPERPDRQ